MTDVLAIDAAAELELHASAWLEFRPGQRRLGLGQPYQRRTDDRAAHAGARSPLEKLLLRRLEVGGKRILSQRRGKGAEGQAIGRSRGDCTTKVHAISSSACTAAQGLARLQASPQLSSSGGLD